MDVSLPASGSWSSRPISTTACSRSARRSRPGAARGATVELLTVFGCDPESAAPRGAGTDGAASRRRASRLAHGARRIVGRARDRGDAGAGCRSGASTTSATATRGTCAAPSRLPSTGRTSCSFPASRSRIPTTNGSCRRSSREGSTLPGSRSMPSSRTRAAWARAAGAGLGLRGRRHGVGVRAGRTQLRDRLAKWRAIRHYRSQLPLLGMRRSLRRGPRRYALAHEWVAWAGD